MQGKYYICQKHGVSECWRVEFCAAGQRLHLRCGCAVPLAEAVPVAVYQVPGRERVDPTEPHRMRRKR